MFNALLVADEASGFANAFRRFLENRGFFVSVVAGAPAARQELKTTPCEIIFDVREHPCDSDSILDLLFWVRGKLSNIPVFIVSESLKPFEEDEARRLGAISFSQPFNPEQLWHSILAELGGGLGQVWGFVRNFAEANWSVYDR